MCKYNRLDNSRLHGVGGARNRRRALGGCHRFPAPSQHTKRDQASRVSVAKTGPRDAVIRNQSDRAIHYVSGWFHDGPEPGVARYKDVPGDTSEDVVAAGEAVRAHASLVPAELGHSAIPYVLFTDADGHRWRRGRGGYLQTARKAQDAGSQNKVRKGRTRQLGSTWHRTCKAWRQRPWWVPFHARFIGRRTSGGSAPTAYLERRGSLLERGGWCRVSAWEMSRLRRSSRALAN